MNRGPCLVLGPPVVVRPPCTAWRYCGSLSTHTMWPPWGRGEGKGQPLSPTSTALGPDLTQWTPRGCSGRHGDEAGQCPGQQTLASEGAGGHPPGPLSCSPSVSLPTPHLAGRHQGLLPPPALLTSLTLTLAPKKHWHICLTSGSDFWGSCTKIHAYCVLGSILGTGDIIQKTEKYPCPHEVNILEVVVGWGRQEISK